jgi:FKBP-type peptidyl-prolyl cis-trans isomerase
MLRTAVLPVVVACAVALAGCGGDDASSPGTATSPGTSPDTLVTDGELVPVTDGSDAGDPGANGKPSVEVPEELPTELQINDLVEGSGRAAESGDTVIVDYVGVRTADGAEFDNSYDRGTPFDVVLGQGRVIPGWDEGLVGARTGGRRQLDIPAELAYGDNPPGGSVIQAGDALTFVIDIRAVVAPADADDAPLDLEVEASEGATQTTFDDIVVGDGATLEEGQTAIVHLLLVRGDNKAVLDNTWERGDPLQIVMVEGSTLPGLLTGLDGMRVGGTRVITMPPSEAFGEDGLPDAGLPANTDVILVVELVGLY